MRCWRHGLRRPRRRTRIHGSQVLGLGYEAETKRCRAPRASISSTDFNTQSTERNLSSTVRLSTPTSSSSHFNCRALWMPVIATAFSMNLTEISRSYGSIDVPTVGDDLIESCTLELDMGPLRFSNGSCVFQSPAAATRWQAMCSATRPGAADRNGLRECHRRAGVKSPGGSTSGSLGKNGPCIDAGMLLLMLISSPPARPRAPARALANPAARAATVEFCAALNLGREFVRDVGREML